MSQYPGEGYPSYAYQGRRLSPPLHPSQGDLGVPNGAASPFQPSYDQVSSIGGSSSASGGDGGATLLRLLRRGETLGQDGMATHNAMQHNPLVSGQKERGYSDLDFLSSSEQRKSPGPWFGQQDPAVAAIGPSRPSYQPFMGGSYRPPENVNGNQMSWQGPPNDFARQHSQRGGLWPADMHPPRCEQWKGSEGMVASGRPEGTLKRLDTLQRLPSDIFEDGSADLLRMLQGNHDPKPSGSGVPPRIAPITSGPSSEDAVYRPGGLPGGHSHHPAPAPIGPRSNPPEHKADFLADIWAATDKESGEWAKGGGMGIPGTGPQEQDKNPMFQQSLSFGRWQSVAASVLDDDSVNGDGVPSPRAPGRVPGAVPSQRASFEADLLRRGALAPGGPLGTVEERGGGAQRSVFDEQYARYAEQVALQAQSEYFYAQQRRLAQAQLELFYQQQLAAQQRSAPSSGRSSRSNSKSPLRGKGPHWPEYDKPMGAFPQYDPPLKLGQGPGYEADPVYWQQGPGRGFVGKGGHAHNQGRNHGLHEKPGAHGQTSAQQWVKIGDQLPGHVGNPGLGLGQHLAKANAGGYGEKGMGMQGLDRFGSFTFPAAGEQNGGQRLQHSDNSGGSSEQGHHPRGGRKTPKNRTPKGTPKGTPTGSPLRSRRGDSKSPLKGREKEDKEGRGRRGEREPQKPKSHMEWRQKSPTPPKEDGPTPPEGVTPQGVTPRSQSPERGVNAPQSTDASKASDSDFLHQLVRQLSLAELAQKDTREWPDPPEGLEIPEQHQDMPSGEERAGMPTELHLQSPIAMAGEQARAQARANAEARAQAKEEQGLAKTRAAPPGFGALNHGFGSQQQLGEAGEEKKQPPRGLEPQLSFKHLVDQGSLEGMGLGLKEAAEENREDGAWKEDSNQGLKAVKDARHRPDLPKINHELLALVGGLIPTEEEDNQKLAFVGRLKTLFEKEWPGTQLYLFGSCANSFGVRNSDVDMCLGVGMAEGTTKSDVVERMAGILNRHGMLDVHALTHARVPIVKFKDHASGIACDICVNNMLAVANTSLLFTYAQIDGRLRQLAFAVKHWAKRRQVNETYRGTLSSYAYVLMCIHYMQGRTPPILPVLQEVLPITYRYEFNGVECAYNDQVENLRGFGAANTESLGELLAGFFEYWAFTHNYNHDVICVRLGRIISKEEKDWTRRIGNERHLICIEDPFETSHDLGRVVDRHSIRVLRDEFHRAVKILRHDPEPAKTLFEPYVRMDREY